MLIDLAHQFGAGLPTVAQMQAENTSLHSHVGTMSLVSAYLTAFKLANSCLHVGINSLPTPCTTPTLPDVSIWLVLREYIIERAPSPVSPLRPSPAALAVAVVVAAAAGPAATAAQFLREWPT